MLSTEECKKLLGNRLTDEQTENLREVLYTLVENVLDEYISSGATIEPTCKNQLSTVESPPSDKKQTVMDSKVRSIAVVN